MGKIQTILQANKLAQGLLLAAFILVTAGAVYLIDRSVTAFLLMLASLLLLYYTSFSNGMKWSIAVFYW